MRNRFQYKTSIWSHFHISYFFFIFSITVFIFFLYGINMIDHSTQEKQKESLHNTVMQCITHCYAVEGTYPPNLDYLKEHYGLFYDEDNYFIDYTSIGANLRPDITIIDKREKP